MDTRSCELFELMEEMQAEGTLKVRSAETGEESRILANALKDVKDADLRKKQMVTLTAEESAQLAGMNRHERRKWLKQERTLRRKAANLAK